MLRDVERASNPWGKPQVERASWAEGLDVHVLADGRPGAGDPLLGWPRRPLDERAARRSAPTATLLQSRGLDFAILGQGEACTGDPARRMGNEYPFQMLRQAGRRDAQRHGVTKS